jgi:tRNA uridine 5-carboxymethylaminomethyl modification enzyme
MDYDAIVVGGGHAGIEASLALARLGRSTLLVTQNPDRIGWMSCNPAIGGLSKGNLVREVDALGGEMGLLIDSALVQFRMLNRSRGPAVQAPRAQADKLRYHMAARAALEGQKGLFVMMDEVVGILVSKDGKRVEGALTARGHKIGCRALVLCSGTFMEGRIFIGEWRADEGRLGEGAAKGLGAWLRLRGLPAGRLKTGTPARVRADSLDYSKMERQEGEPPLPFSFMSPRAPIEPMDCYITYTGEAAHAAIRAGMHRSPLFSGEIVGKGPRYCPSIEDKVKRFPERERHQVFVEPEGRYTNEMYLNGLSSSLPEDVQEAFIHAVPGLERAFIVRPAYAVEYDYLDPIGLTAGLESKLLAGLFCAGQVNGTSGYEEAAAQGIMAGINAHRAMAGEPPFVLSRAEAYIGVLVDDLVTKGVKEPYRMFTSRAEHRLALRHDDADMRLTPKAGALGLASPERMEAFARKARAVEEIAELLGKRRLGDDEAMALGERAGRPGPDSSALRGKTLAEALRVPGFGAREAAALMPSLAVYPEEWLEMVATGMRYSGYVAKQERAIDRAARLESRLIPEGFDYSSAIGVSAEGRELLARVRPRTLGQASRIPGLRQSDIAVLMVLLGR